MTGKKIIIVGRGGSGKNFLAEKLQSKGFKLQVSLTTRPIRGGEVDGKDYHFLSDVEFNAFLENGSIKEWKQFNGWKYGTLKNEWENKDVFIYTPSGVRTLTPEDRAQSFIIFLDIPADICGYRLYQRSDADSAMRRVMADKKDFENFTDYDLRITNPDF